MIPITLATLKAHFRLEPRASDARILKTFRDGYGRIHEIAERKLPAHPAARLELTPDDFSRPSGVASLTQVLTK